jgi:phosphomannomutase
MPDLRSRLNHVPKVLGFGTSGRRGLIADLTQLEIYINVTAEIEYLMSLAPAEGGIRRGDDFYYALDLRPSSPALMEAVARAVEDAGLRGISLGKIPTPALMYYALRHGAASIMITGSHIPFDRNGYKLNTSRGELLKEHEAPIGAQVAEARARIYAQDFDASPFDESGTLRRRSPAAPVLEAGRESYAARYLDFFRGQPGSLAGRRILVYQHSAVARDLLAEVLTQLGAEVIAAGRSDTFVPIDTENIGAEQLETIGELVAEHPNLWAIVSTDGDSDRPLLLACDSTGRLKFFSGDLAGMITAQYLNADAVVVPVTCNDAIDQSALAPALLPKTRIGSPYVVAGMAAAAAKGRQAVCGWEANGGFLLGSGVMRRGHMLAALATRDAFLPILSVLYAAAERDLPVAALFAELPKRFSRAGLLKNFPREMSLRIMERLTAPAASDLLSRHFTPALGFSPIARLDYTDGVRIVFTSGEVAHIRPSGNADELRIYAVADTEARAGAIVAEGLREPDGILRSLQRLV